MKGCAVRFNNSLNFEFSMSDNAYKIFVGNLPYTYKEKDLMDVVINLGGFTPEDISEVIILKEKSQDPSRPARSRGIGFVGFTTPEARDKAISVLNEAEVEYSMRGETCKRPIYVNEARPFVAKQ